MPNWSLPAGYNGIAYSKIACNQHGIMSLRAQTTKSTNNFEYQGITFLTSNLLETKEPTVTVKS